MPDPLDWVEQLTGGRVTRAERLRGGWTSEIRQVEVDLPHGPQLFVLRTFVDEFFVKHAHGLLTREAQVLGQLAGTGIPAAELVGVDAEARYCAHPSLLMTLLPGAVRVEDLGADDRAARLAEQLAEQLAAIHLVQVDDRPRDYQPWTAPDRVRLPSATSRPEVWAAAVDELRREAPAYEGVFLHRDFHPGNVLFDGDQISGVVDWVETSWGPADLDVAHCSTALALLHGPEAGTTFTTLYSVASGRAADHRYWRLLDALAFAPDAEKVAVPWRELGRTDLTPELLQERLELYLQLILEN